MRWLQKLRSLLGKDKLETEMAEEMRLHLELQTELNLKAGMSAEDARYAALRQFGNVASIQEQARAGRGWVWLEQVVSDVRHAGRTLRKSPLSTAVIILSLGIGIGVNVVIFSWIRGLVFRPIPGVKDATRFVLVEPRTETGSHPGTSWAEYQDLRERLASFEELAAFRMLPLNYGQPGREDRIYSQLVTGNYFSSLGLRPARGRLLRADEVSQPGSAAVVVVSFEFWQNQMAGAEDAVGREIRLNNRLLTIVGVAPNGFQGTVLGLSFDAWVPATMAQVLLGGSLELEQREVRGYSMLGTLKSGATIAQAQTELAVVMRQLENDYPAANTAMGAEILSFWRAPRGAPRFLLSGLVALQGFTALVLLMVSANAANLLLARSVARRREIGVRLALGARPRQILRLLLTESLVLGLLASGAGGLLAMWGTTALRAVPLPGGFPFKFQTDLDVGGLLLTVLLGLGCALLFGLAPAVQSARTDTQLALRAARQDLGRSRLGGTLMALEVALALLVLFVAALSMRSFLESRTADTGFKQDGVLLAAYDLSGKGYDRQAGLALMDDLLRKLGDVPGVGAAAIASWVPLDFHAMPSGDFKLDGQARSDGGQNRALSYTVTPGYFKVMGLALTDGTDFAALADASQPNQTVVNEEFVRRYLAGSPALGHRLVGKNGSYEIVGVVRNSLYETFGEPAKPIMYYSYRERFMPYGQIHLRVTGNDTQMNSDLRRILNGINPTLVPYNVRTLSEHVDKNLFFRRIPARLFVVLGPLILLLAAFGIYAVGSYAVTQRTREIGVRLALGASAGQVVSQIVRESMRVVYVGAGLAWLVAVVIMLHARGGILNAPILIGVPLVLLGVALLAAWLPARRAAKVDPVIALRAE